MSEASRSPLEAMIDAACACVKCGQKGSPGTCGCWVKLECPKCGKAKWAERNEFDPPGTAKVRLHCPDCNAGDFDTPAFFDAKGRELSWEDAPAVRDSGSDPKGENPRSGVEGEASQSGAAKTAHRPNPSIGNTPTRNTA